MQKILLDGYNLIHADAELKRLADTSMRAARDALVGRVRGYLERRSVRVTIVFDGAGGMTDAEVVIPGHLQVVYSASGQTADELIVGTLHEASNPREYIVVTSDMADIGRSVRSIGADLLPSREFLDRLAASAETSGDGAHAPDDRSREEAGDVDYWLERFSRRVESPEDD